MPRVKKKSVEYGNRKRKKLAAARHRVYNQSHIVDGSSQMTGEKMPPTPPFMSPYSDDFKTDDLKYQDRKIADLDSKLNILAVSDLKMNSKHEYKAIRPIKGLSELISKSIITAKDAAAAVTAVTTMDSLKKSFVITKKRTAKQPKQTKLQKQKNVKVYLPSQTKTPVLPATSTASTATVKNEKLMVNFKNLGNSSTSSSSSTGSNTQKAYALYVGGQLKYILPYNEPLGAFNNTQQQSNQMKKFICRGVNGKTEVALAKPTVVCDDEKEKIVFVVQKKATTTSPATSLLSKSNKTSEQKPLKVPTLASLSTTTGQSLQGNQVISDNMLKLLLFPSGSLNAVANSSNPTSLPSPVLSTQGHIQKTKINPPQTTQARQQTPVTKSSFSIPIVVKVQRQSATTTTTTNSSTRVITSSTHTPIHTTSSTTTSCDHDYVATPPPHILTSPNSTSSTITHTSSSPIITTTPIPNTSSHTLTPTSSITTAHITNPDGKPQTSVTSSSSSSSPSKSTSSILPVQLFTRDAARKLCPGGPVVLGGNKPCMTILDPTDPEANIHPAMSLLGNLEPIPQTVSKQSSSKETAGANQILIKKTSADNSVILPLDDADAAAAAAGVASSDKDPKLSKQNPTYTNDAQLQLHSQTVMPVSLASDNKIETIPNITAASPPEDEEVEENDEDDGMFGLKISSVFSLAENQPCSEASEAVMDQGRELLHGSPSASFQSDSIPSDTVTTAMKLSVSPEAPKCNDEADKASSEVDKLSNRRTVILDLSANNGSLSSPQENLIIVRDPSQSKSTSSEKSPTSKPTVNVEQQTPGSFDPDLENVLSGKLSVDTQTNCPQKENASPKKASPVVGSEKDFLAGQKYITVDIFRHNGQTKLTAVSSTGKKEITRPSVEPSIKGEGGGGGGEGDSVSSSDDTKLSATGPDARLNEVLQCAAHSLPMGTYFFVPLHDKTVAIPSQKPKKTRSAYIFEKHHNYMQVKMAKYMILNSSYKLPSSIVTSVNGSQLVCQISNPSKKNGESPIVLPVPSMLPMKDVIPTLEAPPIVTGKRIRRPKKHTGFEENMDLIPPLRKCRKRLKPVIKIEKDLKGAANNRKHSKNFMTNIDSKNIAFVNSNTSTTTTTTTTAAATTNNKVLLHPVDSKEDVAAILRSVNLPVTNSSNKNDAPNISYVRVSPPSTFKYATTVSSATNTISQDSYQSGLHIDNVLSLQPEGIKIKPEPITSGYGDEPIKDPSLLTPTPSAQIGRDTLDMPITIKKEPSWYGYESDLSSAPLLSSTSYSDQKATTNISTSKESYSCQTQHAASYKRDHPTKSPSGKKRGRKKKEIDETKPVVKKRKYVRHKTETAVSTSSTAELISHFSLKSEIKIEAADPSYMGSSRQSGETSQEERIRRLKEILREKEQTLEQIRHNLSVSTTNVVDVL